MPTFQGKYIKPLYPGRTGTEQMLAYIADSPPRECNGFDPRTVETAREALKLIARLRAELKKARKRHA